MSTVSTTTAQTTSVSTTPPPPESGLPGYFAQASTRWDIVKFLSPLVFGIAWLLITMHFDMLEVKAEIVVLKAQVAEFQAAKESRGDRMARLETKMDAHDKALDELKQGQRDMSGKLDIILERSTTSK